MDLDIRKLAMAIALIAATTFAVGLSVWTGERLRTAAHQEWLTKGKVDARRMTESVLFWISKAEVNLRAIAGQFRTGEYREQKAFFDFIDDAETWDPDVTFGSVAYARRVLKKDRAAYEEGLGGQLTVVGAADQRAPEEFESFAVELVSRAGDIFDVHADLATHPAMKTVLLTARQRPGHVILGPAFKGKNGDRHALIATATDLSGSTGFMVASINLVGFFSTFSADYLPNGVHVRLIERDSESRATNRFLPIIGGLEPPSVAAATEIIRITSGQARWDLHWDIMPDYLGGPADGSAMLVSLGGSVLALLVAAIVSMILIQNMRFYRLVNERTAELSKNSMLIQLTMDTIDQGFAVWNADHRLVVWSKRCAEFWYNPPKILRPGMHMRDLLQHLARKKAFGDGKAADIAESEFERIVEAGAASDEVFAMTDGRRVHVRRFPLERGGHVAVYTDVTERERATEDLERSRDELERRVEERTQDLRRAKEEAEIASQAKSEFLANMSHELRTPLNPIIGFSQLIANETYGELGDERYRENAAIVATAGEHLLELIADVLDLSKIEANALILDEEPVDLNEVAAAVKDLVAQRATRGDISVTVSSAGTVPLLRADLLRVKQMVLNLAENAVKYTAAGGSVSIGIDSGADGGARIQITDTGVGIAESDLANILQPFSQADSDSMTRHGEGIGLGLSLVKYLIELHGGRLSLESTVGKGTTATLIFPSDRNIKAA